ncbi:MAG: hypothetical protein CO147_01295 [Nitrospirae bacterium CG_4_9_14_3_um_filter_44_28]|nr:MAG: hypothetical protein CO147_01295 [Nitrospirae bacterium CG_4_9_14_3_um_filter_44_28]
MLKMFLLLLIVLTAFTGCAVVHTYGPYYGKVINSETKEPLEGVAVLAVYYTEQHGPAGSVKHYADAQETVTDKNGEFKIPANTATTFRPLQSFEPWAWFAIFKPGYGCYPKHKGVKPMFVPNGTLPDDQYVIIELPKLKTKEERVENQRCEPVLIPKDKYRRFLNIINYERIDLGLEPVPIK